MKRNLDGIFYRVREPDGRWSNTCFSDLTEKQQDEVMKNMNTKMLKSLCKLLAQAIREIGDQLDIAAEYVDEE